MRAATVIFPHQLFWDHPGLQDDNTVYLVEEQLFFFDPEYRIPFHKKKLLLHRASMKAYQDHLTRRGHEVKYLEYHPQLEMEYLFKPMRLEGVREIYYCDPVDHTLEERLLYHSSQHQIQTHELNSTSFLNSKEDIDLYFKTRNHYHLTSFYMDMRKHHNILLEEGKPVGKHWTFDKYNRRKLPRKMKIPSLKILKRGPYREEAARYVEEKFPSHPGTTSGFIYPVTHQEAEEWLDDFLNNRLPYFGDYQDSIHQEKPFLFHSLLSSSLNLGLLTPQEVVARALNKDNIPLNSREGFIRQIIGWREFLRAVYIREGVKQRTRNYFAHQKKMPSRVWRGETGLLPFDCTVKEVYDQAYAHHIERLMILGNLMLLLELDPHEVYHWFMALFIDAYDWVMVPNVYGMSQYADGGLITTKPYISSSNYLLKMSNYPRGEWCDTWNSLFWNFLKKHQDLVEKNPRLAVLKGYLRDENRIKEHQKKARKFMEKMGE
ncbi:MAG: cryptochrome/photolyase family protein [Methanobacteriaceae archaeon]|nr:cryptochrome/photolyase family protein [Methanobacteriaceae archaeon]